MGGHTEEELTRRSSCAVGGGNRCSASIRRVRGACAVCGMAPCRGIRGRPTHPDEREGAARVDGDAPGVVEPGAATGAVEVATDAAAGEHGGRPGGDVNTADPVVAMVLRCIMGQDTEDMLVNRRSGRTGNRCGPYAVCEAGVPSCGMAPCGGAGAANAPRRARRCRSGRSRCHTG